MTAFELDYILTEKGRIAVDADDKDQAEYEGMNQLRDSNPSVVDVDITEIREIE